MVQLLLHLWGDYITQNAWMATTKVKNTLEGYIACVIHCLIYTFPFIVFLNLSPLAVSVIFGTHFILDKWRVAKWFIQLKDGATEQPPYIAFWLLVITDNIFHITINYLSIRYL